MMTENAKEEDSTPVSKDFTLEVAKNTTVKINWKYTLGDTSIQTFCVRYDPNDKYIATGCSDGTIRLFNVLTGKQSFILN